MTGSARNKDFMETIRTRKRIKAGTKTGTTNRIKVTKKITSMATCVPATMATNIMAGHHDRASMAPSYGHGPHHHHAPAPPMPPRLKHMVHHATRGCHDVDVWQVNHDTYIVKYRKGRRYYTQYLYPYSERYGNINLISLNWQPLSPWNLIPRIQLNINL